MILTTVLQDSMEQKKVNIRAMMEEKIKALKERQAVKTVNKTELSPKMQEFLEKMKAKAKERGTATQKGTITPSLLKEKIIAKRNELKSIIEKTKLNKKEVNHD